MTSKRNHILDVAKDKINGDRADDYGDAFENFERIAEGWNIILGTVVKDKGYFDAKDVGLMMMWLKMSRLLHKPDDDGFLDIAGYAALTAECATKDSERKAFVDSIRREPPVTVKV